MWLEKFGRLNLPVRVLSTAWPPMTIKSKVSPMNILSAPKSTMKFPVVELWTALMALMIVFKTIAAEVA